MRKRDIVTTRIFGATLGPVVACGLLLSFSASVQPTAQASNQPTAESSREKWRKTMVKTPRPRRGCFKVSYPETEWKEMQCMAAPLRPFMPARGPRSESVGNGNDFSAEVTSG